MCVLTLTGQRCQDDSLTMVEAASLAIPVGPCGRSPSQTEVFASPERGQHNIAYIELNVLA
jgi:hypothetical protein